MQTKLETCGNLAVPVDESGTATGRATFTPTCPYCGRPFETVDTARELLVSLQRVVGLMRAHTYIDASNIIEQAEAAIAKAKGTAL